METGKQVKRVALAYSGGLDTSVMIPWLRENYGCEVVAVLADVGQREDFDAVRAKAFDTGAIDCQVVDLKEAFAEECILPALRAGAVYEGRYLLGTALARPIIARAQVEVAQATGCDALAHGCTGKGNDQVRFELTYRALAPEMTVIAPWREWEIQSREDSIEYARQRGIPVPATKERPFSIDQNLWHTSFEGGILEDPGALAPADLHDMTVDPVEAPDTPQQVEVEFQAGRPVAVNGQQLELVTLIETLNRIAGAHGVGYVDIVENRLVGMKSRGVYETPAGTVLTTALQDLESITLDRDTVRFKAMVGSRYADLAYQGLWHAPLRTALDGFVEAALGRVSGAVTVQLYKGVCQPVARTSPYTLYREDLATFGDDAVYDHKHAEGFIRLWGLPTEVHARVNGPQVPAPEEPSVKPADERPDGAADPRLDGGPMHRARNRAAGSPSAAGG